MEQHIAKLIPAIGMGGIPEEPNTIAPEIVAIVNKLFVFFYAICRGFEKQYLDPKKLSLEKSQWCHAFRDAGLDDEPKIQLGIKKCRMESPINTPTVGQFIKWCTPSSDDLGLLPAFQAYNRAIEMNRQFAETSKDLSELQIKIIKHVLGEIGTFTMRNLPESSTRPQFDRAYEIAIRDYMAGKLKEIPIAITDNQEETKNDAIGKDFHKFKSYSLAMPEIRKILGMPENATFIE